MTQVTFAACTPDPVLSMTSVAGISEVLSFVAPTSACAGPAPYPFRLGLVSDVGQTFNSSTTMEHLMVRSGA